MSKNILSTVGALFLGFFVLGSETRNSANQDARPAQSAYLSWQSSASICSIAGAAPRIDSRPTGVVRSLGNAGFSLQLLTGASHYAHHRSGAPPLA